MKMTLTCLALAAMLLFSSALSAAVPLVADGKAVATIVIRASALAEKPLVPKHGESGTPDAKVHLAALELQAFVKQISGGELPIVSDEKPPQGPVVLVGASKLTEARGLKIPAGISRSRRGDEAYVIIAKDAALVLAGNDEGPYHGSHFAVAELLNRLGVRWFMPGQFGQIVPQQATISIADVEFRDAPDFPLRSWWSHMRPEMESQEALWKLRNKMQLHPGAVITIPGDSTIRAFTPDPELLQTHPEYFARNADGTPNPHLPSFSHPEARKIAAAKAIAMIDAAVAANGKPPHSIGFSPDDGIPVDYSPQTMKLNQGFVNMVGREGVTAELGTSEEWFAFVNAVAEQVAAKYPDVILTTTGYANRDVPPEGVKLHPNLGVLYAAIWADTLKPFTAANSWHGQVQGAMLKRWCELSDFVFIYNYNYNMLASLLTPTPTVSKLRVNVPLMKQWGVFGFFDETRQAYIEHGITTRYLRTKLYWDADSNVDAILDDFFAQWYGPAAPSGKAFWGALEQRMQETPLLGHEDRILPYVYDAALLAQLRSHVAAGQKQAQTDQQKLHVRVDELIVDNLEAYMAFHAAEFAGDYAGAVVQADRIAAVQTTLTEINPFLVVVPGPKEGVILSGTWAWRLPERRGLNQKMHDLTAGVSGNLVAMAPREVRFTLDEADRGKPLGWYQPGHDRSAWQSVDVTKPYYLQGHLSPDGVPYRGLMWYVFEVDVPAAAAGKPIRLYTPNVVAEAWLWVNGQYIGRRPYLEAYSRPAAIEMDVTSAIKPGQKNTIAVRVGTGMNLTQAPDGFQGRLFLYSPKP